MTFKKVASLDELWGGEKMAVQLDGKRLLLVHLDDQVYAYQDRCAHMAIKISEGELRQEVLICPAHQWEYDARTGKGINPSHVTLKSYPVRVLDNDIFVNMEPDRIADCIIRT